MTSLPINMRSEANRTNGISAIGIPKDNTTCETTRARLGSTPAARIASAGTSRRTRSGCACVDGARLLFVCVAAGAIVTIDALTSLDIPFVLVLLTALAAVGTDPQETSPNHQRRHRCSGSEAHHETRTSDTTTPYQETVKPRANFRHKPGRRSVRCSLTHSQWEVASAG